MKANGDFLSASRIEARLWMLAAVAVLFSLMWTLAGTRVKPSNDQHFVVDNAGIKLSHHPRSPALVPIGFHVSDLAIPLESDRVFSYRQTDEFLRHQANLTAGTRARGNGSDGEGADVDIQIF